MEAGRMDEINVVEKRLEIIMGARLRDRSRIENAMLFQHRID